MAQLLLAGGIIFLLLIRHCLSITLTTQRGFYSRRNGTASTVESSGEKAEETCTTRLETALYNMRTNRRSGGGTVAGASPLDLNGYALHQALRTAPYDMYLTDMRVRAPAKWARVDKCRFDPITGTLQARLAFRDLSVTGKVKLYNEKLVYLLPPVERCNMTLRMRQAGVGFTVHTGPDRTFVVSQPTPGRAHVHMAATFVEPQFVSVHSYGCESPGDEALRRTEATAGRSSDSPLKQLDENEPRAEMSQEMEEVFLRGVRSLLVRYMEHHMEPALRDTLMMNLETYIVEDETTRIELTDATSSTAAPTTTTVTNGVMMEKPMNNTVPEQLANPNLIRANRITFYDLLGFR